MESQRQTWKKIEDNPKNKKNEKFPIVGIGSSIDELEALERLFSNIPPDSGMGFVLIQNLNSLHKNSAVELIAGYTDMEVLEIKNGMHVQPDKVYVTPQNKIIKIINGKLSVDKPSEPDYLRPIDLFFQTLADAQKDNSIGIILSGSGSDGINGLKAIKNAGGMVIVPDSIFKSSDIMPSRAIATDLIDYVVPPEKIHEYLVSYIRRKKKSQIKIIGQDKEMLNSRQKILDLVKDRTGHNFFLYKESTINRRIRRRMAILQMNNISYYQKYMQENPCEANILFKEFLINVTQFFRDPNAFNVFEEKLKLEVLDKKVDGDKLRIWIPGCSTGEEVYSTAIIIQEYLEESGKNLEVRIFGTDSDDEAISKARSAVYPSTISNDMDPERARKFFTKKDDSYKVKKDIREMAIFVIHDILIDPPFSKIDAVSCRNVLIYMNKDAQNKILSAFNYALKPEGILFLGPSESLSNFTGSFTTLNSKWKIYKLKKSES